MGIVLSGKTEELAARRAAEAGFRNASDYIEQLVAADARDASDTALEALLLEGTADAGADLDVEAMRAEGMALIASRRQAS